MDYDPKCKNSPKTPSLLKEMAKRRLSAGPTSQLCEEKQIWNCRQMKSNKLLNGGILFVPLIHMELEWRNGANDVGRSPSKDGR